MRSIIKGRPSVVIWRDGVEKTWCSGATPWGWWKETGASKKVHQQQRVSKQCIVHPDVMLQTLHKNHNTLMLCVWIVFRRKKTWHLNTADLWCWKEICASTVHQLHQSSRAFWHFAPKLYFIAWCCVQIVLRPEWHILLKSSKFAGPLPGVRAWQVRI